MADEYTPTTEQVRAFALGFGGMRSPEHWENWLAAHDREVARRAWQEGFSASERCWEETYDLTTPDEDRTDPRNPYREENRP